MIEIIKLENKFSIVMVEETIDSYCYGMVLLLKITNMTAYHFDYGTKGSPVLQARWSLLDSLLKEI